MTAAEPGPAALGPYLKRSAAAHAVLLGAALWALNRPAALPEAVYRIDFVGSTAVIMNRAPAGAPPKAAPAPAPAPLAKPAPQKDPDTLHLRPSLRPLPRPSFLDAAQPPKKEPKPSPRSPVMREAAPAPLPAAAAAAAAEAPGSGVGAVSADMPDFPYPWYLTSLRQKLWAQWTARRPGGEAEAQVMFSILRDGSLVDLRVESTSGDAAFDYAALSAVRAAAPLPPLPPAFRERFLRVHVQFKSS